MYIAKEIKVALCILCSQSTLHQNVIQKHIRYTIQETLIKEPRHQVRIQNVQDRLMYEGHF